MSGHSTNQTDESPALLTRDPLVMAGLALVSVAFVSHFGTVYPSVLASAGAVCILLGILCQWWGVGE